MIELQNFSKLHRLAIAAGVVLQAGSTDAVTFGAAISCVGYPW